MKKTSAGNTTIFLGMDVEIAGGVMTKYLPGDTKRTAGTTYWMHRDHLNSIRVVTDAGATVVQRSNYRPYGERLQTIALVPETKGYIGERHDDETGLVYLHARYYDPVLGRFLQADTLDPTVPGVDVNRYSYAGNNPVMASDPSGRFVFSPGIAGDIKRLTREPGNTSGTPRAGGVTPVAGFPQQSHIGNPSVPGQNPYSQQQQEMLDALARALGYADWDSVPTEDKVMMGIGMGVDMLDGGPSGEGPLIGGALITTTKVVKKNADEVLKAIDKAYNHVSQVVRDRLDKLKNAINKNLKESDLEGAFKEKNGEIVGINRKTNKPLDHQTEVANAGNTMNKARDAIDARIGYGKTPDTERSLLNDLRDKIDALQKSVNDFLGGN